MNKDLQSEQFQEIPWRLGLEHSRGGEASVGIGHVGCWCNGRVESVTNIQTDLVLQ